MPEPIFSSVTKLLKVRKIRRDNNTLGNIEFKIGEENRFVKNRFDKFEELEAAQGSSNVVGASSNNTVRGFLIGGPKLTLEGVKETKEGVSSNRKAEASRGAALHNTRQNLIKQGLSPLGKI